jgi:hypothetical protein
MVDAADSPGGSPTAARWPAAIWRNRKRNRLAFAVDHKHLIQGADVLGVDRIDLHHHFILVQRLVDGGDLPLAEGVVQQIVGVLR